VWAANAVSLIHAYDPEMLILGGGVMQSSDTVLSFVQDYVNIHTWSSWGKTLYCSGKGSTVLEISATPYIFTFKLWDWGRLGLDGGPRPIHIAYGVANIQWDHTTGWVRENLINCLRPIASTETWREEHTGLNEREFIETRRHWFTTIVPHATSGGVNVLNLVHGDEVIVESPTRSFEPFLVHYAETFIVPAAVGEYTIRPYGASLGKECATIKAFVRAEPTHERL
jgi:hypothetical protein